MKRSTLASGEARSRSTASDSSPLPLHEAGSFEVADRGRATGSTRPVATHRRHLLVSDSSRMHCLLVRDIRWCEADGNYVRLHFTSGTFRVRASMADFADRLPSEFVRVNRSSLVNMHYIKELRTAPSGDYDVVLQDGTGRALTRGHRRSFLDAFIVV